MPAAMQRQQAATCPQNLASQALPCSCSSGSPVASQVRRVHVHEPTQRTAASACTALAHGLAVSDAYEVQVVVPLLLDVGGGELRGAQRFLRGRER